MKKSMLIITVNSLLLALLMGGCDSNPEEEITQMDQQTESQSAGEPALPFSEEIVLTSKDDLSKRLGTDIDEIHVAFIKPVTWPDTSLGYSQEGTEYDQEITEGYQILLECEGYIYEYHTDRTENIVACASAPSGEIDIPKMDASYEDFWPNQPLSGGFVIIEPLDK